MSWRTFLESAPAAAHGVQVYTELDELAASVGRFLDAGFRAGQPAIVIATAGHWDAFAAELERRGHDLDELQEQGLLTARDADETLAALMEGEVPSPKRFADVVGGLVETVASRFPDTTPRAFGEMVDLLFQRGEQAAAIELEELWNRLMETRSFALLCAYELDLFDLDVQTSALPEIVRTHTHPRPVAEPARLAAAVHETLTDVLGSDAAAWVYLRVAEDVPRTALPRGQAVLMWLSRHQPAIAQRVLQGARVRYAAAV
ncbi:MAG TPA: MEDS domain-containing protein [Gaiellaceae bacterium]|nr:MEDS domain-containing protein [Gaiellaceae bacterium]